MFVENNIDSWTLNCRFKEREYLEDNFSVLDKLFGVCTQLNFLEKKKAIRIKFLA